MNNLILDNLNKEDGEDIMRTIAQKYIKEGCQEGEQIGLSKGVKKIATNMIAQITGLELEEIKNLKVR